MPRHLEWHRAHRSGWLRAAVLGANDGIVSTASLLVGVAVAGAGPHNLLVIGLAGLVAGAMSMAAGEYVSVHSQADTQRADLERERRELATQHSHEHEELAAIYVARGLDAPLAQEVATQLMEHDALGAHARDELGITDASIARPVQAALASAASFAVGAALPLLLTLAAPAAGRLPMLVLGSLLGLAAMGWLAARTGGAAPLTAAARVTAWGAGAMLITAGIGLLLGGAV